jgi:glycosyltransferase involved in cell wall biosynthesis
MKEKPLLSFALFSCNQEAFIRAAIEGAFAQTYSPLEIIISDDCSKDRTFEIATEMAAAYRGPHTVRLNRNETNLGIGAHVNRVMEMRRGELVFFAAGDDVSMPARVEVTYQAWEQFERRPTSICSSYMTISETGEEMGMGGMRGDPKDTRALKLLEGSLSNFVITRTPAVCGCSHALTPKLFDYFGPLMSGLEDLLLSFRSLAIGQILYIQQPLVKYRRHGSNVSFFAGGDDTRSFAHRESRLRWVNQQTVNAYDNMLADIEVLHRKGRLTAGERENLSREAEKVRTIYAVECDMMDGGIFKRLSALAKAAFGGHLKSAMRLSPRLLPRPLYQALYTLQGRARGVTPVKT